MKSLYLVVAVLSVGSFAYGEDGAECDYSVMQIANRMPETAQEWGEYYEHCDNMLRIVAERKCSFALEFENLVWNLKRKQRNYAKGFVSREELKTAYNQLEVYIRGVMQQKCME